MSRRLFNFTAAASLLLCLASVVLWVVGYHRSLTFEFVGRDGRLWEVAARHGQFALDTDPQDWIDAMPSKQFETQFMKLDWTHQAISQKFEKMLRMARNKQVSQNAWDEYVRDEYNPKLEEFLDQAKRMMRFDQTHSPYLATPAAHSLNCLTVVAFFAVLPAIWMSFWLLSIRRNANRRAMNVCVPCGYDLTGNTSGVCPECGTATSCAEGR